MRADNKKQHISRYHSLLYRIVFETALVRLGVFFIFIFLLVQPVAPVFAQSVAATSSDSVDPSVQTDTPLQSSDVHTADQSTATSSVTSDIQSQSTDSIQTTDQSSSSLSVTSVDTLTTSNKTSTSTSNQSTSSASSKIVATSTGVQTQSSTTTSSGALNSNDQSTTSLTDGVASSTLVSTTTGQTVVSTVHDTQSSSSNASNSNTDANTEVSTTTLTNKQHIKVASSTTTATTTITSSSTEPVTFSEHSSHAFEFNAGDCAVVGSGAYYCSNAKNSPAPLEDGVFAAPDSSGDMEIYVRLNGKQTQLTSNNTDNSAPFYDPQSQRIVWQSLINDRYQILSYDLKTNKQVQLTSTPYNNMQPVAYGDLTIWQAWINNNWEIMLFDGVSTTRLTNNNFQDVSPHMRSGYIVWQSQFSDGWQVAVYDTKTKQIEYVKSDEGAKVDNPRFVLVYDSTDASGDIKTIGYDPDKKVSFTINTIPATVPDKLPEPDQTGQPRAIIQNKTVSKDSESDLNDLLRSNSLGSSTPPLPPTATSSATGTLIVLPSLSTSTPLSISSSSQSVSVASTSHDLIIPPYTPNASSSTEVPASEASSSIPDVLVTPIEATST